MDKPEPLIPNELLPLPDPDVIDIGRFGLCWHEEGVLAYGRQVAARYEARIAELERSRDELVQKMHQLERERDALTDTLRRKGFVPCDIAACNCGSWHHRYGLPQRMEEIREALTEAGHPLCNENGHLALKALAALVVERDALRADAERYQWLRGRDLNTIAAGGVFAGMTPQNIVINGADLDSRIDAERATESNPNA